METQLMITFKNDKTATKITFASDISSTSEQMFCHYEHVS